MDKKLDVIIAVGIPVILWFLFRNKNGASVISSPASAVDNTPLNSPTFTPNDYSVSPNNPGNPSYYFSGGGNSTVNNYGSESLSNKYIPLFGFINGVATSSAAPSFEGTFLPAASVSVGQNLATSPVVTAPPPPVIGHNTPTVVKSQPVITPSIVNYKAPAPPIVKPFVVSQVVDYADRNNTSQPANIYGNLSVASGSRTSEFANGTTKVFNKYSDGSFSLA